MQTNRLLPLSGGEFNISNCPSESDTIKNELRLNRNNIGCCVHYFALGTSIKTLLVCKSHIKCNFLLIILTFSNEDFQHFVS